MFSIVLKPEDSVDTGKLQNLDLQAYAHKVNTFRVQTDFIVRKVIQMNVPAHFSQGFYVYCFTTLLYLFTMIINC